MSSGILISPSKLGPENENCPRNRFAQEVNN